MLVVTHIDDFMLWAKQRVSYSFANDQRPQANTGSKTAIRSDRQHAFYTLSLACYKSMNRRKGGFWSWMPLLFSIYLNHGDDHGVLMVEMVDEDAASLFTVRYTVQPNGTRRNFQFSSQFN